MINGCGIKVQTKLQSTKYNLVSAKLKGVHLNWIRFCRQFDVEIDKSNLTPAIKFLYLKEFVDVKVKILIDVLLFTSEEYNQAKSILSVKSAGSSEVVNADIQKIMHLPTINRNIP